MMTPIMHTFRRMSNPTSGHRMPDFACRHARFNVPQRSLAARGDTLLVLHNCADRKLTCGAERTHWSQLIIRASQARQPGQARYCQANAANHNTALAD